MGQTNWFKGVKICGWLFSKNYNSHDSRNLSCPWISGAYRLTLALITSQPQLFLRDASSSSPAVLLGGWDGTQWSGIPEEDCICFAQMLKKLQQDFLVQLKLTIFRYSRQEICVFVSFWWRNFSLALVFESAEGGIVYSHS